MKSLSWMGIMVLACFAASVGTAQAHHLSRGVYFVDGTNSYYFIDDAGARHVLVNPEVVRTKYFRDVPVVKTTESDLDTLPLGSEVTETTGPDTIIHRKTVIHDDGTQETTTKTIQR